MKYRENPEFSWSYSRTMVGLKTRNSMQNLRTDTKI